jgi:hypothetical protein
VELVQLAETDPDHELIVAVRLALDVIRGRREWARAHRQAGHAISAEMRRRGEFRPDREHVPYAELQRRRAVVGPLAREGAA